MPADRCQNNVRSCCRLLQLIERNSFAAKGLRHGDGAFVRAIAEKYFSCAMGEQVPCRQLRHLARTNNVNGLLVQRAKDLFR